MEFRKVFDTIPEQFDKYRPRYSAELFADLIAYANIEPSKAVLDQEPDRLQNRFWRQVVITMPLSLVSTCLK